jgi:hypothetical protein
VSHTDLTRAAWLKLSDEAATRTAEAIARATDAALVAVAPHAYAGGSNRIALFERGGTRYALVPGGTAVLGHQTGQWVPSPRQVADFAAAASAYDVAEPIDTFVAKATSPARTVTLAAALVAVRSIGDDPYRSEFTTDPAVLCGGDGGEVLCGGYGPFLAWLALATAYREPDLAAAIYDGGLTGETPVRPVLPLP